MANFPKMKLTNAGLNLLTNVQAGADDLVFTKTVLGNGELSTPLASLTALVSPKVEIAITEGKRVGTNTYQIAAFFSNAEITTGFWWREIGVFAKGNDGKEILYCYSNAGDAGDYIPVGSDERVEKYIYQSLAIGNAESVVVEINANDTFIHTSEKGSAGGIAPLDETGKVAAEFLPSMNYASTADVLKIASDLDTHLKTSNPHNVTAATVGLDKVPNVATNDQTPTYTEASTLTGLTSGEKMSIAFGKIKKAITDFVSHLADTTKHITSAERTTWNGKAPSSHASTDTTYGVGTSSNYGHLKITDSKTSTATDTAASAKALKETYDVANGNALKLLKTQTLSNVSITTAHYSSPYTVNISGIDFTKYDYLKIKLKGKISASVPPIHVGMISVYLFSTSFRRILGTHFSTDSKRNSNGVAEVSIDGTQIDLFCEREIYRTWRCQEDGTITYEDNSDYYTKWYASKASAGSSDAYSETYSYAKSEEGNWLNLLFKSGSDTFGGTMTINGSIEVYGREA